MVVGSHSKQWQTWQQNKKLRGQVLTTGLSKERNLEVVKVSQSQLQAAYFLQEGASPKPPQTASPSGDQMFKYPSLWETFSFRSIREGYFILLYYILFKTLHLFSLCVYVSVFSVCLCVCVCRSQFSSSPMKVWGIEVLRIGSECFYPLVHSRELPY